MIMQDWFGLLVKKGASDDVAARLNLAINKALAQPRVREAIAKLAADPAGGTPAEFGGIRRLSTCPLEQGCEGLRHYDAAMT